jgi:hypothetical protein
MWLCKVSNIYWKQRLPTTCGCNKFIFSLLPWFCCRRWCLLMSCVLWVFIFMCLTHSSRGRGVRCRCYMMWWSVCTATKTRWAGPNRWVCTAESNTAIFVPVLFSISPSPVWSFSCVPAPVPVPVPHKAERWTLRVAGLAGVRSRRLGDYFYCDSCGVRGYARGTDNPSTAPTSPVSRLIPLTKQHY